MDVTTSSTQSEFLAQVAHDLRNPLNTIVLAAQQLADLGHDSPDVQRAIARVRRAASYMTTIIQEALTHNRSSAGATTREMLKPEDAIDDVLEINQSIAAAKGVELERSVDAALPSISADKAGIERVLDNLVANAVKFTEPGGRVAIGAAAQGDDIVFSVADSGGGIAPDEISRLFESGWQRHRGRDGYGLGLAIAKRLVTEHGGRMWVSSSAGRGSTFYAALPVTRTHDHRGAA